MPPTLAKRKDQGEQGRWRRFKRDAIAERGDNLDIAWLKDEAETEGSELLEPAVLALKAAKELNAALVDLHALLTELGEEIEEESV